MLLALPPLQALMMISSSMILSLILLLPLCTTKTSWLRTLTLMLTLVSPLANLRSSHFAGAVPRRSQMAAVRAGCEVPEKIWTPRMLKWYKCGVEIESGGCCEEKEKS